MSKEAPVRGNCAPLNPREGSYWEISLCPLLIICWMASQRKNCQQITQVWGQMSGNRSSWQRVFQKFSFSWGQWWFRRAEVGQLKGFREQQLCLHSLSFTIILIIITKGLLKRNFIIIIIIIINFEAGIVDIMCMYPTIRIFIRLKPSSRGQSRKIYGVANL